jgi:hypothetical protein
MCLLFSQWDTRLARVAESKYRDVGNLGQTHPIRQGNAVKLTRDVWPDVRPYTRIAREVQPIPLDNPAHPCTSWWVHVGETVNDF